MQHKGERHRLELLVADVTDQPPIIGRDWLSKIKIDWKGVFHVKSRTLQQVFDKHETVFEKGLGTMKKFKVKLHLKSGATPKFVKARPVPFHFAPKWRRRLKSWSKRECWRESLTVSGDHLLSLSPRKPEA